MRMRMKMDWYTVLIVIIIGVFWCISLLLFERIRKESKKAAEADLKRNILLFHTSVEWIRLLQEKKSVAIYLEKHNYTKVAIYGMGYLGERLVEECKDSRVEVKYGIDRSAGRIYSDIPIYYPEDPLESVDAIIVTAITFYDDIKETLSKKIDCTILSLEDILNDM